MAEDSEEGEEERNNAKGTRQRERKGENCDGSFARVVFSPSRKENERSQRFPLSFQECEENATDRASERRARESIFFSWPTNLTDEFIQTNTFVC